MDSVIFFWAIVSMIFSGIQMFIAKVAAHNKEDSALNTIFTYGISFGLLASVWSMHPSVPEAWQWVALVAFTSGVTHGIGSIFRIDALRYIDSTLYFPMNKVLGPLVVVFCGVALLGESLSSAQLCGVLVSLTIPLLLITPREKGRQNNLRRGLVLLVVSTALTASSIVLVKIAAVHGTNVVFMMLMGQLGGTLTAYATYLYQRREKTHVRMSRFTIQIGAASGIVSCISFYSLAIALHTGSLSLVYTINAHYILIPIFLSVWWYGEHINMRKLAAVALSCLTITLLY